MPDQLQLRGGTTVQHSTFTGASKEVTVDTTKKTVVVHDGSTAGGNPVMREDASNSALALGSAGTPSLKFTGDTNTGIYSPGADQVSVATGGTERLRIDSTGQIEAVSLGTAAAPTFTFTGDPDTGVYSPGANQLAISTGGSGGLFVNSSGNIGINVASPTQARLVVASSAGANTGYFTDGTNSTIKFLHGGGGAVITTEPGQYLGLGTADTERLRITSAGLVGVGTSVPVGKLAVGNSSNNFLVSIDSTASYAEIQAYNAPLYINRQGNNTILNASGGSVGIGVSSVSDQLELASGNYRGVTIKCGTTAHRPTLSFFNTADSLAAYIQASGNSLVFGSMSTDWGGHSPRMTLNGTGLGIGTTSPTVPLQVLNAGAGNNTNNGAINLCRAASVGSTLYHMYSTAVSDEAFAFSVHGGTTFSDTTYTKYLASAGGVHIWYGATNATERARIDSSGRLLVGTSSDSGGALFQVNGDRIRVGTAKTPASATATGTAGEICWDTSYIYVCTATNTWKRAALSTW